MRHAALIAALMLAGCGGGDGERVRTEPLELPEPAPTVPYVEPAPLVEPEPEHDMVVLIPVPPVDAVEEQPDHIDITIVGEPDPEPAEPAEPVAPVVEGPCADDSVAGLLMQSEDLQGFYWLSCEGGA